tara:strand:+ start:1814 stop:3124 length:1311 start_codon:yes stop_codon:yes gene_type:complete
MWIGTDCQQDEVFNENTYTWPTGQKYTGEFIKNPNTSKNNSPMIPHGKGTCEYPDGRKFVGTFNLGVPAEGKWNVLTDIKQDNKMYTSDGRVYEGNWINGNARLTLHTGTIYEGVFKDGKIIKGTMTYPSGRKWNGKFDENMQRYIHDPVKETIVPRGKRIYYGEVNEFGEEDGIGYFTIEDGTQGAGEFKNGHLSGISVLQRASGETYAIDRKGNDKEGHGIYIWPAKNAYEEDTWYIGEFKKAKPEGFAIFKTSYGYTWVGEVNRSWMPVAGNGTWYNRYNKPVELPIWIGGEKKFEGFGTLIADNGIYYQGEWLNGLRHGWGIYIKPDGYRYEGEFKNDKKHGKGIFFKAKHNNVYEGDFADNLPNGYGIRYMAEGFKGNVIYRGKFKNGLFEGKGELRFSDRTSFFGTWSNGELITDDLKRYEEQTGSPYHI